MGVLPRARERGRPGWPLERARGGRRLVAERACNCETTPSPAGSVPWITPTPRLTGAEESPPSYANRPPAHGVAADERRLRGRRGQPRGAEHATIAAQHQPSTRGKPPNCGEIRETPTRWRGRPYGGRPTGSPSATSRAASARPATTRAAGTRPSRGRTCARSRARRRCCRRRRPGSPRPRACGPRRRRRGRRSRRRGRRLRPPSRLRRRECGAARRRAACGRRPTRPASSARAATRLSTAPVSASTTTTSGPSE